MQRERASLSADALQRPTASDFTRLAGNVFSLGQFTSDGLCRVDAIHGRSGRIWNTLRPQPGQPYRGFSR